VRALLLVQVKAFAIVAPYAFRFHDLRAADRSPFAGFLADLAAVTFRPALDAKDRQVGNDAERRSDRAEKAAVEVAHENRRSQQYGEADPHRGRAETREHPERLGVLHRRREIVRDQVIHDDAAEQSVFDPRDPAFDRLWNVDPKLVRDDRVHQLGERAIGADPSAVQAAP